MSWALGCTAASGSGEPDGSTSPLGKGVPTAVAVGGAHEAQGGPQRLLFLGGGEGGGDDAAAAGTHRRGRQHQSTQGQLDLVVHVPLLFAFTDQREVGRGSPQRISKGEKSAQNDRDPLRFAKREQREKATI